MPIQTLAYACAFKCGRRVTTKRPAIVAHEAQCIHNPSTRSCPTCSLNRFEAAEPEVGIDGGYYCDANHLEKGQRFAKNCPHWTDAEPCQHGGFRQSFGKWLS